MMLKSAFKTQTAGGYIRIVQLVFHQSPDNPAPGSIWSTWQRGLECIKNHTGLSFALHDAERTREALRQSGYVLVDDQVEPLRVLPGAYVYDSHDILSAIAEMMKGVLVRACELDDLGEKSSLLRSLEDEVQKGLDVKVSV